MERQKLNVKIPMWDGYYCEICQMANDKSSDDDRLCALRRELFTRCFTAARKSNPCEECLNMKANGQKDTPELCDECPVHIIAKRKDNFGLANNEIWKRYNWRDHVLNPCEERELKGACHA